MKKALGVLLLLAAGLGVCEPLAAETIRYSGRLPRFTAVTRDDYRATTATDWQNVPGTWVEFTTTKQGPAVATFCGTTATGSADSVAMRIAGVGDWKPRLVQMDHGNLLFKARCMTSFAVLPAGTHRIRVQWITNGTAAVEVRSLKVDHEK